MTENHRTTALRSAETVARLAIIAGLCGALSTVPFPPPVRALLLVVLVLVGFGSAAMCWVDLPPAVTVAAVLGISIVFVLSLAVIMAWLRVWHPVPSCLLLSTVVAVCGYARLRTLRKKTAETA